MKFTVERDQFSDQRVFDSEGRCICTVHDGGSSHTQPSKRVSKQEAERTAQRIAAMLEKGAEVTLDGYSEAEQRKASERMLHDAETAADEAADHDSDIRTVAKDIGIDVPQVLESPVDLEF